MLFLSGSVRCVFLKNIVIVEIVIFDEKQFYIKHTIFQSQNSHLRSDSKNMRPFLDELHMRKIQIFDKKINNFYPQILFSTEIAYLWHFDQISRNSQMPK